MKKKFTIKEYREFIGIKQVDISNELEISQAAYSKIESGESVTSENRYEKIASLLNLEVEKY